MNTVGNRRCTVHFDGRVQGVGFRYTAVRVAAEYQVSGFVKNLTDGRVLLVVEGRRKQLYTLIQAICDQMGRYIRQHRVEESEATGQYGESAPGSFGIQY